MKKIFILICLSALAVSCGSKNNTVNSASPNASGSEGLEIGALTANFTGEYDILRKDSQDCSNTIRIVSECNGLRIVSNGFNAPEEFCNINRGAQRSTRNNGHNSNPPLPDRDNGEIQIVTLNGNTVSSELRINERISFTNSLTMNPNGVLVKISNLKSRTSRCIYQKR